MNTKTKTKQIRILNDNLRRTRTGGQVVITSGLHGLGQQRVRQILKEVAAFENFNAYNDPHSEHDCAVQQIDGQKIIWKIDYYDLSLRYHSEDPADPSKTCRVLTVMLAHEY
ncbi:DUF3768 domain-containing protein [uncultured Sneathiella sp.]|jgi:hypothetical protein|uniref:DUF3768 domain-containing protein n=1 Tax=uncultured Sneathiella sp. TaxID=879315 RepID=UPI0030DA25EB|tara:strand:- start:14248 stop:14583 length:336 start_codon:yes stop_codon:yes gene_type:complete